MPRIRTLKPEHRTHRKTGALSDTAYRLWVGMIMEADDDGRLVADAEQLRVLIFGYQPDTRRGLVEASLQEIVTTGLVLLYEVEGVRYAWFPSWLDHQKIDRKTPSKLPPYTPPSADSSRARRGLVEGSIPIKDQGSRIKEGIGSEPLSGNGARQDTSKPGNTEAHQGLEAHEAEAPATAPARSGRLRVVSDNTAAREILDYLNRRTGRAYEPVEANLKLIRARLAEPGRTRQQVLAVIDMKVAEWLKDPEMTVYLRPKTLFGAEKFAQYVGALAQGKAEPLPETPEEAYVRKQLTLMGEVVTLEQAKIRLAKMAKVEGTHVG